MSQHDGKVVPSSLQRTVTLSSYSLNCEPLYALGEDCYVSVWRDEERKLFIYVRKITSLPEGIAEYGIKLSPHEYCSMIYFIQRLLDASEKNVLFECKTKTYQLGRTSYLDVIYNGKDAECEFQIIHEFRPEIRPDGEVDDSVDVEKLNEMLDKADNDYKITLSRSEFLNLKQNEFFFCKSCNPKGYNRPPICE